ncbi:DUF5642 family protein [Mycobacterium shimoidei]|uniref:DUF5642 family protein n=1 Tax=Mycobacterium shimoidei TaxID=29313 RepID=UPI000A0296D8|nr:DUF5642 family protein [Mycobacterium shimoidei]MCV7259250.1 DUF5642 family protein [Mycobacterium shimoidei]
MIRAALVIGCVLCLAACGSSDSASTSADITKISTVKSSFGPEFKVKDTPKTGIDPKVLAPHKLPEGVKFQPPDCAKFVTGEDMPPGLQGNMAAVAAEGDGNRFIAIAVQTNQPVPVNEPGKNCKQVGFVGGRVRGVVEVVDAPKIAGAQTLGVHRVLQTVVQGKPRTGELYNYSAHFGDYQVIVTANPVLAPDQPVPPVDINRARELLVKAVAAIRS